MINIAGLPTKDGKEPTGKKVELTRETGMGNMTCFHLPEIGGDSVGETEKLFLGTVQRMATATMDDVTAGYDLLGQVVMKRPMRNAASLDKARGFEDVTRLLLNISLPMKAAAGRLGTASQHFAKGMRRHIMTTAVAAQVKLVPAPPYPGRSYFKLFGRGAGAVRYVLKVVAGRRPTEPAADHGLATKAEVAVVRSAEAPAEKLPVHDHQLVICGRANSVGYSPSRGGKLLIRLWVLTRRGRLGRVDELHNTLTSEGTPLASMGTMLEAESCRARGIFKLWDLGRVVIMV